MTTQEEILEEVKKFNTNVEQLKTAVQQVLANQMLMDEIKKHFGIMTSFYGTADEIQQLLIEIQAIPPLQIDEI